jgi:hypothetical protein
MFAEHELPAAARLVHIGPPKTGTTAMQSAFMKVRRQLPEHGAHYAGRGSRPKRAVAALTGGGVARRDRPAMSAWYELSREVASAGDLRVCISNEQFATADDEQAAKVIADLGGERAHVVMVVRPLGALLPSQWQQRVRKKRDMAPFDEWLREVLSEQSGGSHYGHFWRLHDVAGHIRRWSAAAAPSRVTVVVSKEGDRGFLPRLFEGFLGLPEGMLVPAVDWANRSLDLTEAELVRSLDRIAREHDWPHEVYAGDVKASVSRFLRSRPKESGAPILLPDWAAERVAELDAGREMTLRDTPIQVIGDPGALTCMPTPERARETSALPTAVPLETAVGLVGTVVEAMLRREEAIDARRRRDLPTRPARTAGVAARAMGRLQRHR